MPRTGAWQITDPLKRREPQDLHCGEESAGSVARRADVSDSDKAGSDGAFGAVQPETKIRMALELLHPPRPSGQDESVAALVERHFGQEAVDRLADPLLSGIYGGDATQLSARTVLPKLVEMETQYGSLTRGMLAAHRQMRAKMAAMKTANGCSRGN